VKPRSSQARPWLPLLAGVLLPLSALAAPQRQLDEADYASRLRAMWLAESIATWTGLRSEGKITGPPFLTDADWGSDLGKGPLEFVLSLDPWPGDDDTDVEYVALHAMTQAGSPWLTPEQLASAWLAHMDDEYLWVSNQQALDLMRRGVLPPGTGLPAANQSWLKIDAQLTTELFGALAPGLPETALALADLAIQNTAGGHAAHASQFFVILYSLAPVSDPALPMRDRILSLYAQARALIPDTSKAADIADTILADFLANPDMSDWERTRDLVYTRYQLNAAANNFKYRQWTESSVNFATGLIALLYGQGDLLRTIQIGTLSGWDSDNGTATMGGLLGLMLGHDALIAQIEAGLGAPPGSLALSDRYDIERTRDNLPDHTPSDPGAHDTFTLMASRMIPLVEHTILAQGGLTDPHLNRWLLPRPIPPTSITLESANPFVGRWMSSASARVRAAGGLVSTATSAVGSPPSSRGSGAKARLANGFELDGSGIDVLSDAERLYFSTEGATVAPGATITLTVTYDREVDATTIRFIEGDHFDGSEPGAVGGWFDTLSLEVRTGGSWTPVPITGAPQDAARPFQVIDFPLSTTGAATLPVSGVRITGLPGGSARFVTCTELDLLSTIPGPTRPSFDLNADTIVDVEDLYTWHASTDPVLTDLNADGSVDTSDREYLEAAVRWMEQSDITANRRP
jgi:hypothetical protein